MLHLVLGCYLGEMSSLVSHEDDSIETLCMLEQYIQALLNMISRTNSMHMDNFSSSYFLESECAFFTLSKSFLIIEEKWNLGQSYIWIATITIIYYLKNEHQ